MCPTIRHNEVRDVMADLLTDICLDVCVEPHLQPLSGETMSTHSASTEDNERLDVVASGFWGGRFKRAFFDVRVFNPHAPSNRSSHGYRRHEQEKRLKYKQPIREIEHASFAPFVMSCTGGTGPCATVILKRLGAMLANSPYSKIVGLLRCRLSFALLCSYVMCLVMPDPLYGVRDIMVWPLPDLATAKGLVSSH